MMRAPASTRAYLHAPSRASTRLHAPPRAAPGQDRRALRCRGVRALDGTLLLHESAASHAAAVVGFACLSRHACTQGAAMLYATARQLVDLFISSSHLRCQAAELAPSAALLADMAPVPYALILMHNDATLLRRRCLTLAAEYAKRWPVRVAACATFVDLAPALSTTAAIAREHLVSLVSPELEAVLSEARGFAHVGEDASAGHAAELATKRLIHKLRKLYHTWADALPPTVCTELLAASLDAPIRALNAQLLSLRHISEADSRALQQLVVVPLASATLDGVLDARPTGMPAAAGASGSSSIPPAIRIDDPHEATLSSLREWAGRARRYTCLRRMLQVGWLLGARLAHIYELREQGELETLSASELLTMLTALFERSALASDAAASRFVSQLEEAAAQERQAWLPSRSHA